MNRKRIGALLIGATLLVGALGSFAYFTSKTGIAGNAGEGELQKLNITNGKVVITAKVADGENIDYDWTYDVARLSTTEDGTTSETITAFEDRHRSPDINVADDDKGDVNDLSRAVIGAALPATVQFTRPGDAVVLGTAKVGGEEANGLIIQNDSNLTIKVRLIIKDTDADKDGIQNTQIEAMKAAGWKMYINNENVDLSALTDGINLGVVGPGGTMPEVDIRFELPIDAGNEYQNAIAAGTGNSALDLNQLIEIQATQENNTSWEQME